MVSAAVTGVRAIMHEAERPEMVQGLIPGIVMQVGGLEHEP